MVYPSVSSGGDVVYAVHVIRFVARIRYPMMCASVIYSDLGMKYLNPSLIQPVLFKITVLL